MLSDFKPLFIVLSLFIINIFLVSVMGRINNEYVGYLIFSLCVVLLPLLVLLSKDSLNTIAGNPAIDKKLKIFIWLLASFPTLIFGVLSFGFGVSIVLWVLYNFLIERLPEFTGGEFFVGFGIGLPLIGFGIFCFRSLWIKGKSV